MPLSNYDKNILSLSKGSLDIRFLVGNVSLPSLCPLEMVRVRRKGCGFDTFMGPRFMQTLTALQSCNAGCELGKRLCTSLCTW